MLFHTNINFVCFIQQRVAVYGCTLSQPSLSFPPERFAQDIIKMHLIWSISFFLLLFILHWIRNSFMVNWQNSFTFVICNSVFLLTYVNDLCDRLYFPLDCPCLPTYFFFSFIPNAIVPLEFVNLLQKCILVFISIYIYIHIYWWHQIISICIVYNYYCMAMGKLIKIPIVRKFHLWHFYRNILFLLNGKCVRGTKWMQMNGINGQTVQQYLERKHFYSWTNSLLFV